jgi:hypothetical protein
MGDTLASIATVGEGMPDRGEAIERCAPQRWSAITVLYGGLVHRQDQASPVGIDRNMSLAALDLLAGVVTARAASFGGLDALAVNNDGRRGARRPRRSRSSITR